MNRDKRVWKTLIDYHKEMQDWKSKGYATKYGTTEITGKALSQLNEIYEPKVDEEKLWEIIEDNVHESEDIDGNWTTDASAEEIARALTKRKEEWLK